MKKIIFQSIVILLLLASCSVEPETISIPTPLNTSTPVPIPTQPTPSEVQQEFSIGLTYHSPDGNRYLEGFADLPNTSPIDIPLKGQPMWVVGTAVEGGSVWAVALADGTIQAFKIVDNKVSEITLNTNTLPAGQPPALGNFSGDLGLVFAPFNIGSTYNHPVVFNANQQAFLLQNGELVFKTGDDQVHLDINALHDGRLLTDGDGNILVLSGPTDQYDHGVLGDSIEASSITLISNDGNQLSVQPISIPAGKVIEGIMPVWVDLTGDGQREIIVTLSDSSNGAQLAVFNQAGELIALGDSIGQGYRWRHQIAAAPFGPNGELEIVDVLTPHIGGTVEFFQLVGDMLVRVAQVSGYTSHVIGTRNLDMAVAGDFDNDGIIELLLPGQDRTTLGGIQRTETGAVVDWELPLNGILISNLGSVAFQDGSIGIAAGLDNGTLMIWLP